MKQKNSVQSVMLIGANSQIADFLIPRLIETGFFVTAVSRQPPPNQNTAGLRWVKADVSHQLPTLEGDALVHMAPLWMLPPVLDELLAGGVKKVVAFGSTSVFSKARSTDPKEVLFSERLKKSEDAIGKKCTLAGVPWTILRPTLIYGAGKDKNITFISHVLRRFGFFPVVGGGLGLRQPVHADDLAAATIAALAKKDLCQAYDLSGGETLTYRDMVFRIAGSHAWYRAPSIPLWLFRLAIHVARRLPGLGFIGPSMADRITEDLVFDHGVATRELGYNPRRFSPLDPVSNPESTPLPGEPDNGTPHAPSLRGRK